MKLVISQFIIYFLTYLFTITSVKTRKKKKICALSILLKNISIKFETFKFIELI